MGPPKFYKHWGCGACTEQSYCSPLGINNNEDEWIARVNLGTLDNETGADNNGFGDYTSLAATVLDPGASYTINLEPGYSAQAFSEYFLVWIDYNQDGIFDDEEIAFDSGSAAPMGVSGTVVVPNNAAPGITRMRIVMQFNGPGGSCSLSGAGIWGDGRLLRRDNWRKYRRLYSTSRIGYDGGK